MIYIAKLREYNSQIQEVVRKINSFHSNERLFQAMTEEYLSKKSELDSLCRKWDQEYLPAQEKVKQLCAELYVAENHYEMFQRAIKLETEGLSVIELEQAIAQMKHEDLDTINTIVTGGEHLTARGSYATTNTQESEASNSNISFTSGSSLETFVTNLDGPNPVPQECFPQKKVGHSWSITYAANRLTELETEYQSTEHKRRSLGSRTCMLSAKLQAIDREIASYKNKMLAPPQALYKPFEERLNAYKIDVFIEQLLAHKSSEAQLSTPTSSNSHIAEFQLPPLEMSFLTDF